MLYNFEASVYLVFGGIWSVSLFGGLGQVVFHVLRHRLACDGFVENQWRHFFKLLPQLSAHLDVHLGETKPLVLL